MTYNFKEMVLRLSKSLSMAFKYPIEGPVILGAAKCQHLITVALVPPGPRALESHMTNEFVRRFNPTTANGIAPSTHLPIVEPILVVLEIHPAIVNRFERFFKGGLHAPQPT
jgi:hypothetical protein